MDQIKYLSEDINGVRTLSIITLTLLLDEKVLTREQVIERVQLFLDGLTEDRRNGAEGKFLENFLNPPANGKPVLSLVED